MKIIARTDFGCSEACALEVKHVLGVEAEVHDEYISWDSSIEDACTFTYMTQTALRVMLCTDDAKYFQTTWKVDADEDLIATVAKKIDTGTVDLTNPDTVIHAFLDKETLISGIDLGGELWKRDWRVMLSRRSLRSTVAASVALYAGTDGKIVDPFSDDGTLGIEIQLVRTGTSPRSYVKKFPYEKLGFKKNDVPKPKETPPIHVFTQDVKDMKAIRMNSKLAGVSLDTTKLPIEWLHTKIERADKIITYPPSSGKALPEKKARSLQKELFQQAQDILGKEGTMTCITLKPDELREQSGDWKETSTRDVRMGNLPITILTFQQ